MRFFITKLAVAVVLASAFVGCTTPPQDDALPTLLVLPSATPKTPTVTLPPATEVAAIAPTNSPQPVLSDTPSPTFTPSATETATDGPSPTSTLTPSMTITDTPTRTPSPTPWPTEVEGPLFELARLALSATVVTPDYRLLTATATGQPGTGVQPSLCLPPLGGFGTAYTANPSLNPMLGCSQGNTLNYGAAVQRFERGLMVYVASVPSAIYVIYDNGRWVQYADTFVDGVDPNSGNETPPAGLFEPIRGFGKVWRGNADVRGGLGWATGTETGTTITALYFERGQMIAIPLYGQIAALGTSGQSQIVTGSP